jgi:hypothetical protein
MFDYSDDEDDMLTTPGVVSSGQEFPVRHNDLVQANAGTGQYNPAAYPMAPLGLRGSPDGIGSYSRLYQMPTPSATRSGVLGRVLNGSPLVRGFRAVSGLGDDAAAAPATALPGTAAPVAAASAIVVAAAVTGIVLSGVGGYYVGKAVAPSRDRESKYAWWGVAAALLGGPIGLGIEAIIALEHK